MELARPVDEDGGDEKVELELGKGRAVEVHDTFREEREDDICQDVEALRLPCQVGKVVDETEEEEEVEVEVEVGDQCSLVDEMTETDGMDGLGGDGCDDGKS